MSRRRLLRPPAGERCDFAFPGPDATIRRCPNPATVSALTTEKESVLSEHWICEDCYAKRSEMFVRRTKP